MRTTSLSLGCVAAMILGTACGDDGGGEGGAGGNATASTTATGATSTGTTTTGTTTSGTTTTTSSTGTAMCLMFGSDCMSSDVCCDAAGQTGQCYAFGMGSKCTIPCPPNPDDCPNNGLGCNNMDPAVCRVPN